MTLTPNSNATSYLDVADFLTRTDVRKVCQLVSDTNTAVLASSLPTNANLLACLQGASGLVEMAATLGERYLPADLAAMVTSATNGTHVLFDLIAVLTWNRLVQRRLDLNIPPHPMTEWADSVMNSLANGDRIFPFQESQAASVFSHQIETEQDILKRNGMITQARRYYWLLAQESCGYPRW